jgi:subtilisin family serine protease
MTNSYRRPAENTLTTPPDELLLAALERGDGSHTGRIIITFRQGALDAGLRSLSARGAQVVDARDFENQAVSMDALGGADLLVFPTLGQGLLSGTAAAAMDMTAESAPSPDDPVSTSPEGFVFDLRGTAEFGRSVQPAPRGVSQEYLRGFAQAAEVIARDLYGGRQEQVVEEEQEALVLGATWGLLACRVPQSEQTGAGVRVAVLDTGMDLGHPDFTGRQLQSETFVGQPVQDLHSHGTHCIGTACGPVAPPGSTPRYGIAHRSSVFVGKVLSNSGSGVDGGILAGINWALANKCEVVSMSLGKRTGVEVPYTAAGQAALDNGLLIVAAAGNDGGATNSPANAPTIMAVASLEPDLTPSSFSSLGKVDIAAPGRDVFSSVPRPPHYGIKTGTSMAAPHAAGCAALWAQTSASLRGKDLWQKLLDTAEPLPHPRSRVGAGLVQAP